MTYQVHLPVFSGPMDLLLHLVKQHEVHVRDITISKILDDYLRHLEVLETLDLADIGDFAVMASTLMEIKSRELLPREEVEVDQELDPRDDLVERLLEYKRFRDISRRFEKLSRRRSRQVAAHMPFPEELREQEGREFELDLGDFEVWNLTEAFARLLDEIGQDKILHVEIEKRNVSYYTEKVLTVLQSKPEVSFDEIFDKSSGRYGLIGILIACLEMMKQGYVSFVQEREFGPIVLTYVGPPGMTHEEFMRREYGTEDEDADAEARGGMEVTGEDQE